MKGCLSKFLIILLVAPVALDGATIEELREQVKSREGEIKALEAEIATYQGALDKQAGVSKTLKNEIARLESQIKKLNADIRLTEFQIQKTELTISELALEIEDKERNIDEDEGALAELLRSIYENDEHTLIEMLLSGESISDFLGNTESFQNISQGIQEKLDELIATKKALEDERGSQLKKEEELDSFRKDLSARRTAQETVNGSKKKLLLDSKNQEVRYQKTLKEREEKRKLILKEIQGIEDELRKLIDPSSLPAKRPGLLAWPVPNPQITQSFGFTEFATTYGSDVYSGNGHNGVDFRAPIGTRIFAAAEGVVKGVGNTDTVCPGGSYGKWILVEHPNNLSTLYAHLSSINITMGTQVARGQIIGYSGESGFVTGPHLHFTVYASNTYRLHKTRHCGLVPAGGYLNPLDYL